MSIASRLEKLERASTAINSQPDHVIQYIVTYGDDGEAARRAADAEYRATHTIATDADIMFFCIRLVSPNDPPEWIWNGKPPEETLQ